MNKTSKILSYLLFFLLLSAQEHNHKLHSTKHQFKDAERWSKVFEDSARDQWQKPEYVIQTMNIKPDDIIADIGSATGYFPVRFAKSVPKGKVVGIDVEKEMVEYLNQRAIKEKIKNLSSVLGDFNDPKIPLTADIIFLCDTYHHIENRIVYFKNLQKYLKNTGELVIVDFKKGELPLGPPDSEKISPEMVIKELEFAGYQLSKRDETLPYQYMLIFKWVIS